MPLAEADGSHVVPVDGVAGRHHGACDPFHPLWAVIDCANKVAGTQVIDQHVAAWRQQPCASRKANREVTLLAVRRKAGILGLISRKLAQIDRLDRLRLEGDLVGIGAELGCEIDVAVGILDQDSRNLGCRAVNIGDDRIVDRRRIERLIGAAIDRNVSPPPTALLSVSYTVALPLPKPVEPGEN